MDMPDVKILHYFGDEDRLYVKVLLYETTVGHMAKIDINWKGMKSTLHCTRKTANEHIARLTRARGIRLAAHTLEEQ